MASRHAPIRHTCPDIDNCIKWLNEAKHLIESALNGLGDVNNTVDPDSIYNLTQSIKQDLKGALDYVDIERTLNELRDSNSALRDWGHELVSEIEKMESE